MGSIYKTPEGEQLVKERYRKFLANWPVPNKQFHVATSQGDTFVIASGPHDAPALVLLHGSSFNSVTWMGDVAEWAKHFRVFAVDVIGHPGLSAPSRPAYQSSAYACWLDDVLNALELQQAAFVGISLGGWLALDYAIRRPQRVAGLVLLCPGGVGREKIGVLKLMFVILPLLLLGKHGRKTAASMMLGAPPATATGPAQAVGSFMALVFAHFRQNTARVARFTDAALRGLKIPVLAVLGANDAMLNSAETKRRLEQAVPDLEIEWLPHAGHVIVGQTNVISDFLRRKLQSPTA